MAKYEIVGVQESKGTFKPKDKPMTEIAYDNLLLHCLRKDMAVKGVCVEVVKIKMEQAAELIAEAGGDIGGFVGHTYEIDFSRFGKVTNAERIK